MTEIHLLETDLPKTRSHESHLHISPMTKFNQPDLMRENSNYEMKISLNYFGSKSLPWWFLVSYFVGLNPAGST